MSKKSEPFARLIKVVGKGDTYTIINNTVINLSISANALASFVYMLSRPNNSKLSVDVLKDKFQTSKRSITLALQELERLQLLNREQTNKGNWEYTIFSSPELNTHPISAKDVISGHTKRIKSNEECKRTLDTLQKGNRELTANERKLDHPLKNERVVDHPLRNEGVPTPSEMRGPIINNSLSKDIDINIDIDRVEESSTSSLRSSVSASSTLHPDGRKPGKQKIADTEGSCIVGSQGYQSTAKFAQWLLPQLTDSQLAALPELQAFHPSGSMEEALEFAIEQFLFVDYHITAFKGYAVPGKDVTAHLQGYLANRYLKHDCTVSFTCALRRDMAMYAFRDLFQHPQFRSGKQVAQLVHLALNLSQCSTLASLVPWIYAIDYDYVVTPQALLAYLSSRDINVAAAV